MKLFPSSLETIHGISQEIRAGRRTCAEVTETCLARIDELEPHVKAWVVIDREGARRRARELDRELAGGHWSGPLHGIPLGVKDIVDVAGIPTACGWPRWAGRLAGEDAPIVARLRAAGAVILGKTVTTQLAAFDPPATRNPWNLERTPGGSSSGSAAAVACGMCLGAIGTQTGGSIIRPASFCGVAGLKPTYGLLDGRGILPLAPRMDHPGLIARTVRDLAVLFDAISDSSNEPLPDAVPSFDLDEEPPEPPRLGRVRGIFDERADPQTRKAFENALSALAREDAIVTEPLLPESFSGVLHHHRVIMAREAALEHRALFEAHRGEFLPKIRELIEEGIATTETKYRESRRHRTRLMDEITSTLNDLEALVTPAAISPAPDVSTTGDPSFNSPWSYTGLPAISFPMGLSGDGLPLGIQLVGHRFGESRLFRLARWCEGKLGSVL